MEAEHRLCKSAMVHRGVWCRLLHQRFFVLFQASIEVEKALTEITYFCILGSHQNH